MLKKTDKRKPEESIKFTATYVTNKMWHETGSSILSMYWQLNCKNNEHPTVMIS